VRAGRAASRAAAAALLAAACAGSAAACRERTPAPPAALPRGEGARRMGERLEDLIRRTDPTQNFSMNAARAELLRQGLDRAPSASQRMSLLDLMALELLNAGRTEEAIRIAESLLDPAPEVAADAPPEAETRDFLALCYLRLGEQENCIARHGIESCLVPIRGSGVHTVQRGSRAAIREYTALLNKDPGHLGWRWLLNLAAMTVGEYPGGVPKEWLVPPRVFESEHDVKRFVDVAPRAGLSVTSHAGGGIMEDFDGDGLLDLMASSMGLRDPLRFFRNDGDGTFGERTREAGLEGEMGGLNIVHADYDNDGHPDLLVLRGGWMRAGGRLPNSLLRNNGDGTFDDVTEAAGILSYHPTQTAAFGDYDNDGWLDLVIGNESQPDDLHPSELYRNNGDGTFTDRSADLGGADFGYVKAVTWGDFNNDGRQDLWVAALEGSSRLLRNDGPAAGRDGGRPGRGRGGGPAWRFTDVTRAAGTIEPRDAFPSWFWDYDNDGWLDLLVGGYRVTDPGDFTRLYLGMPVRSELPRLYRNNRDGTLRDVTREARLDRVILPMGSNYGDLDNDGHPDCYFGTGQPSLSGLVPNRMFRNSGAGTFQEVSTAGGFGHLQKGHGVAFGDIDNDGDQDVFQVIGGWYEGDVGRNVLYRNPGHGNRFVTLRLEGRRSNRSAIGARIRVRVAEGGRERDIHAVVDTGGTFGGNSLQQEIGLGRAEAVPEIEVVWPASGERQVFREVAPDRVYRIVEGEPALIPVAVRKVDL
jgi:hypothetical protein